MYRCVLLFAVDYSLSSFYYYFADHNFSINDVFQACTLPSDNISANSNLKTNYMDSVSVPCKTIRSSVRKYKNVFVDRIHLISKCN